MLEQIKMSLRIQHDKLDYDIQHNISACLLDLQRVGVVTADNPDDNSEIIKQAIVLYIKWQYNFEERGEQYEKCYNSLRDSLSMCADYNGKAEVKPNV